MRSTHALTVTLAVVLSACQATRQTPRTSQQIRPQEARCPARPIEFIVVQLNDVYEISPLDGGRVGGMARVATVVNQLRAKNPNTIAILSGDFLNPSLISSLDGDPGGTTKIAGEQMVAAMNGVGIDYVTFGNHEFDISLASLQSRLRELNATLISSNVWHKTDSRTIQPFVQLTGGVEMPVPEHVVHTFKTDMCKDVRLGLIGLTLAFNITDYVDYDSVDVAGTRAFNAASAESDLVFAITHLTIHQDSALARQIPQIPLVMGGHEHEDMLTQVGHTRITKADANAKTVYIHWVTYHPETGETDVWSQLMPITEDIAEDPAVKSIVTLWEDKANGAIRAMGYYPDSVLADFEEPYDGRGASVRNKPTNLGRTVACAMLHADNTAELAFLNSGSIRIDDQLMGDITHRDVLRAVPFGGAIVHGSIRGDVLKRILDIGSGENQGEGGFLQVTPNVERQNGGVVINGTPLEAGRRYEVVLPAFMSEGRESNLDFMKGLDYRPLQLRGVDGSEKNDLRDVVMEYLESKGAAWEECVPASSSTNR